MISILVNNNPLQVEEGENRVYLEVNVLNQDGQPTCPGHAVVVLP